LILELIVAIVIFFASAYLFLFVIGQVQHFWGTTILKLIIILVIVSIFIVGKGILLSHRIAGPIYHVQNDLKKIAEGDLLSETRTRNRDEFKSLVTSMNEAKKNLAEKLLISGDKINSLKRYVAELESLTKERGWEDPFVFDKIYAIKNEVDAIREQIRI
jgi:methyl-accepting chemotaxis protein